SPFQREVERLGGKLPGTSDLRAAKEAKAAGATQASREAAAVGKSMFPALGGNSCFVAGTLLLTPDSEKPIEKFRVGDRILSRDEISPDSPVVVQVVEKTFVRTAPVLALQVGGRTIRTTAEHPFFVKRKGWLCAKEVQVGDDMSSHDGQWVTV